MIVLDTCVLIFDALSPQKMTAAAKKAIVNAEAKGQLYCCDISLREIAMLIQKKRLDPGTDAETFLRLVLQARQLQVLNITLDIAVLSADSSYNHYDPADRLIAATAIHHRAKLVTSDKRLRDIPNVSTIW
jgi:PIN domain nuclease of toxin-antitoxin system